MDYGSLQSHTSCVAGGAGSERGDWVLTKLVLLGSIPSPPCLQTPPNGDCKVCGVCGGAALGCGDPSLPRSPPPPLCCSRLPCSGAPVGELLNALPKCLLQRFCSSQCQEEEELGRQLLAAGWSHPRGSLSLGAARVDFACCTPRGSVKRQGWEHPAVPLERLLFEPGFGGPELPVGSAFRHIQKQWSPNCGSGPESWWVVRQKLAS